MGKFGETDDGKWKNLAFRPNLWYWVQRSIHKFKVQSCALKMWIFRFLRKLKMTKSAVLCKWIFFAAAVSFKLLGCFLLTHCARNGNVLPSLQVDISPFLQKAQYDKVTCKSPCHTDLPCHICKSCHTEHSFLSYWAQRSIHKFKVS